LTSQLGPVLGTELSAPVIQQALDRIIYTESTRRVSVRLRAGTRLEYTLPVAVRPGVSGADASATRSGRLPRITRLMALAIRIQGLVCERSRANYGELADVGRISRSRLSQILRLTELAPAIQEEILFLPRTMTGNDPVTERSLRQIARLVDWEAQVEQFRALTGSRRNC
jgi:hypothetical protein